MSQKLSSNFTLRMSAKLMTELKQLADNYGIEVAEVIRRWAEVAVERHEIPGFIKKPKPK